MKSPLQELVDTFAFQGRVDPCNPCPSEFQKGMHAAFNQASDQLANALVAFEEEWKQERDRAYQLLFGWEGEK